MGGKYSPTPKYSSEDLEGCEIRKTSLRADSKITAHRETFRQHRAPTGDPDFGGLVEGRIFVFVDVVMGGFLNFLLMRMQRK